MPANEVRQHMEVNGVRHRERVSFSYWKFPKDGL